MLEFYFMIRVIRNYYIFLLNFNPYFIQYTLLENLSKVQVNFFNYLASMNQIFRLFVIFINDIILLSYSEINQKINTKKLKS